MSNDNEVVATINLLVAANFKASCGVTVHITKYTPKKGNIIKFSGEVVEFVEPTSGGFIIFAQNEEHDHLEASFFPHGQVITMDIEEVAA